MNGKFLSTRPLQNVEEESKVQYDSHFIDDDERLSNEHHDESSGGENLEEEPSNSFGLMT